MSLPIPINVDLETARGTFRVTRDLRDLSYRSVVSGGFASAQASLDRPLDIDPADIAYYGTMTISDGRHGGVVWQGRMEDPSRGVGSDGRIWELAVVGPSAHARDKTVPYVPVCRDLAHWQREASKEAGRDSNDDRNGEPAIMLHAPSGSSWTINQEIRRSDRWVQEAGQNLGRVSWRMVAGVGDSDWNMQGFVADDGTVTVVRSNTLTTVEQGLSARVVGTDWTHPASRFVLRLINVAGEAGADNKWVKFWDVRVRSTLFDASGSEQTSGSFYTADTVLASEIVADLLGRLLDQYDGSTARIDTTTTAIEQLAYPDGVTPAEVLEDLTQFEPDHYWAAWERTINDTARFEYVAWPTTVAYEATAEDGYTSTGSATDLYNEVRIRWKDAGGRIRTKIRTQTVPELDDAGLTRIAHIDLGDNLATAFDAITAGDNFLAEHATPRNAGSLTVARPVLDHSTGRLVAPWEIRPGKLIRVRGIQPRMDALNPGNRDGVTVFRVVGHSFDSRSATAQLELDSQPVTLKHVIGQLPALARASLDRRRR